MKTKILFIGICFFLAIKILSQPYHWWTSSYSSPAPGSQDTACGIAMDNSGNLYIGGLGNGFNTGSDIILIKLNSFTGDTIWVKRYTGPGADEDRPLAMTSDENFIYLTGFSFQPSRDIITLKYDHSGNLVWVRTYNGSNNGGDYGFAIKADAQGNVYVTGRSDENNLQHYTTIKYNSAGTQQWVAVYGGPLSSSFDQAMSIAVDNNGVYVTGLTTVLQNFHTADYLTVKYDHNGILQWAKRYNGTANDEDGAVAVLALNNSIYVTGRSDSSNGNYNFCTIKYAAGNGDSLACAFYIGPALRQIDNATDMCADGSGNIYVTGYSMGISNTFDYATVKYNSDLQQLWAARYEGSGNDIPCDLMVVNSNIFVIGSSIAGAGNDFLTAKYNSSGSQMWTARFNGPVSGQDHCASVMVDQSNNVFVTGFGRVSASEDNIFTLRYSDNPIGIQPVSGNVPGSHQLYQNYPNPFNPSTNINFDIPAGAVNTQLAIYDLLGRQVEMIVNQQLQPGRYSVSWNAAKYSSGIYFYKLVSGNYTKTNKMVLVE